MEEMKEICRSFVFFNYHIPMEIEHDLKFSYITTGFFDGMNTEIIKIDFKNNNFSELWEYNLKWYSDEKRDYSHQNVFAFGNDKWNMCSDDFFWSDETSKNFPLTFVVFLQLADYKVQYDISKQCERIKNDFEYLENDGKGYAYAYSTIDKNDFVVCFKCKEYKEAVNAIKALHDGIVRRVVYSYTIFSVSWKVLSEIDLTRYDFLRKQYLDSICLKGIANSFNKEIENKISLDQKYHKYCDLLCEKLNDPDDNKNFEYKIYDILGDNDFRLIARSVNLGRLLKEMGEEGLLNGRNRVVQFYLFSFNLVLNTITDDAKNMESDIIENTLSEMKKEFFAKNCNELLNNMKNIYAYINDDSVCHNEQMVTMCYAVVQLAQSLRALERAPVTKYDFYSLYEPLSILIDVLEDKLEKAKSDPDIIAKLCTNHIIYNFIHKISMTLHGTLRTDIQFFQIRDFNAIVHYAPARLRAFYSLWVLKVADFYNAFTNEENKYSFIFSPGMFSQIEIQRMLDEYESNYRLLLITLPERSLYNSKWLSLYLCHEVSHFVGYTLRNREKRNEIWIKITARVLSLEIKKYQFEYLNEKEYIDFEEFISDADLLEHDLLTAIVKEEKDLKKQYNNWPHEYHSKNSMERIIDSCEKICGNIDKNTDIKIIEKIIFDEAGKIYHKICNNSNNDIKRKIYKEINGLIDNSLKYYSIFHYQYLNDVLLSLKYLMSETFADLMAILTLHISPMDYFMSFVNAGVKYRIQNNSENEYSSLFIIRVAVVIQAVEEHIKKNRLLYHKYYKDFFNNWHENTIYKLEAELKEKIDELKIFNDIETYYSYVRKDKLIHEYICRYNFIEKDFTNSFLDFYNDKNVWEYFLEYLLSCADSFEKGIEKSDDNKFMNLKYAREELEQTYQASSGNSALNLIQEIEKFLDKYEKIKAKARAEPLMEK